MMDYLSAHYARRSATNLTSMVESLSSGGEKKNKRQEARPSAYFFIRCALNISTRMFLFIRGRLDADFNFFSPEAPVL